MQASPDEAIWLAEGRRFGAYLLRKPPSELLVARYAAAMEVLHPHVNQSDGRLLRLVQDHVQVLSLVDSGLALVRPDSVIRTKLLVMSAILEATPEHADSFLPVGRSTGYVPYAAYVGLRAGLKGVIGALLVRWI